MKLADYRRKRDPSRTPEPFGKEPPEAPANAREGAFVIHLHDATRRHYDLRIEAGGVLASFAVPRGPSLDPASLRLAVRTEDHPLEYLEFEAVIPARSYGAGAMILWDRGRLRALEGSVEEGLAKGKLDFELEGLKVRGRFALVKIKGETDDWLLIKKSDAFASPGGARDPVRESPRSVLSGLTVEELGEAPRIGAELVARAAALGAPAAPLDARHLVPMLCALEGAPEASREWLYELKLDGVRALAIKENGSTTLVGRSLRETTANYPEVARAVQALVPDRVVLDGEIVAFDASGRPSFQRLSQRIHLTRPGQLRQAVLDTPVTFVAFDVLAVGDRDLCDLPLVARKELLHRLLPSPGVLRALDHLEDDAAPLLAFCDDLELEGVVAKRKASPYRPGPRRGGDWVKIKRRRDADFVVVGFTAGEGSRSRLGALDLAAYEGGELVMRGKIGSGLDERDLEGLLHRLAPLAVPALAARGKLQPAPRGRTFVRPEVVVRARFAGFSDEGQLRHGVFAGVRDDIDPRECTDGPRHEPEEKPPPAANLRAKSSGREDRGLGALSMASEPQRGERAIKARREKRRPPPPAAEPEVAITNRDKVLWPGEGITKGELCEYYRAIAPAMLSHLLDRPIMLVRHPDGIEGKSFYQWNVPAGTPGWVRTFRMPDDKGDPVEVFLVDGARALAHVANLATIPIHVLASRTATLAECDFLTMDFDVKGASLREGIELALALRELLDRLGLTGFPKTSGQSGLHVFVPLGPGVSYATARALADLLGRLLVERHPNIATMERVIAKRGPRVYVDTGQTGPTRTIVAPYAVRARPGATVSAPLEWDEVEPGLDPAAFSIKTMPARYRERGDPMARLLSVRPDVARAVVRLEELVRR